jgi:hypothetical protein
MRVTKRGEGNSLATQWVDDPTLDAPDGHRWVRPVDECPDCPCHMAPVCTQRRWSEAVMPTYPDGRPIHTAPCPCEQRDQKRAAAPAAGEESVPDD